jgi:flavin reductase (DIM6/NTAB) family NADH-FMN oxidoreductase RutF
LFGPTARIEPVPGPVHGFRHVRVANVTQTQLRRGCTRLCTAQTGPRLTPGLALVGPRELFGEERGMPSAPDPVADIDGATFRRVVGHLASGVTVISCAVDGKPHGMTASSVTSLSADPPMMLACVNRSAPTSVAIRAAGGFVVNVLRAGQEHMAQQFARPSDDKFAGVATTYGALSMPVLREALAYLECEVREQVDAGTHTILLGRVVNASASDGEPLAYFRGGFGRLQPSPEAAAADSRATQKAVSARGVLEAGVIAVALAGVGDRELRTVAREFVRMDDLHSEDVLVDVDGFFSANVDFHRSIVELASNPVVTSALDRLDLGPLLARTQAGATRCSVELIEVQRDLLKALLDRDVDAAIEYVLAYAAMAVDRTRELSGANER